MKSVHTGYLLAAGSVLLTALAQLAMKWGMTHLPEAAGFSADFIKTLLHQGASWLVVGGILAYLLSMLCWLQALHHLPLNKAYPLLSLSYALVYLATALLPWFNESFTLAQTLGVLLISLGVWQVVANHRD
jgi:undecaprenyl phosphate-alpha-L-ara4N flippase subunit ArnF